MSDRQTACGSRVTSAAARSQDSSAARHHSSSASWMASSGRPASTGSRADDPELQQDQQRRLVEDVVRVHVRGLVGEHHAAAVVVEDPHELRVEHDDRLVGPDRGGVGQRELGQVEVRHIVHVERVEDLPVQDPDARQLPLAEPHGGAERRRPQRPLVAERHQPAHHLVEVGHLGERGAGRPVGRMLVRPRRDPLELPGRFDLLGHPPKRRSDPSGCGRWQAGSSSAPRAGPIPASSRSGTRRG